MRKNFIIYVTIIAASIAFRLALFYPSFFPNADAGEYAAFVHEIAMNGGFLPSYNSIYFPGSNYIYPPFLFYVTYIIWIPVSRILPDSPYSMLYILLGIAIFAGSIMNALIYRYAAHYKTGFLNFICIIIPVFFSIDIYSLTWGGFPFIVDLLFFVAVLLYLEKDKWNAADIAVITLLSAAVPLTHDLTWFIFEIAVFLILLFNILKHRSYRVKQSLLVLSVSSALGLYWWLPRLKFVLSAFFVSQSYGSGPFTSTAGQSVDLLLVALYLLPVIFMSFLEIVGTIRNRKMENVDSFTLAMISTAVGIIFITRDIVLTARIILYTYTFLMIVVLKNLHLLEDAVRGIKRSDIIKKLKFASLIMLVVAIPGQLYTGVYSTHFYSSGEYQYDPGLIKWASSNMVNGTIGAPLIGNYLSGVDGLPVILYSGFIVGGNQINERNAVIDLILFPNANFTVQEVEKYHITYIVVQNNYINSTVDSHLLTFSSSPFHFMRRFSYYTVYSIGY